MQTFNSLDRFFREAAPGDRFANIDSTLQEILTYVSREDYGGEDHSVILNGTSLALRKHGQNVGKHVKSRVMFSRPQDSFSAALREEWHEIAGTKAEFLSQDADVLLENEALNAHVEHFDSPVSSQEEEFKVGDIVGHGLIIDGGPGLLAKIESIDGDVITLDNGDEFVLDDQGVAVSTGNAGRDRLYALEPNSTAVAESAMGSIGFCSYQIAHFARPEYIENDADLVREYQEKIERVINLFEEYLSRS